MYPCQNESLETYNKDVPDAWRTYRCIIKGETLQIRNNKDISTEVLFKFCNGCNFI